MKKSTINPRWEIRALSPLTFDSPKLPDDYLLSLELR